MTSIPPITRHQHRHLATISLLAATLTQNARAFDPIAPTTAAPQIDRINRVHRQPTTGNETPESTSTPIVPNIKTTVAAPPPAPIHSQQPMTTVIDGRTYYVIPASQIAGMPVGDKQWLLVEANPGANPAPALAPAPQRAPSVPTPSSYPQPQPQSQPQPQPYTIVEPGLFAGNLPYAEEDPTMIGQGDGYPSSLPEPPLTSGPRPPLPAAPVTQLPNTGPSSNSGVTYPDAQMIPDPQITEAPLPAIPPPTATPLPVPVVDYGLMLRQGRFEEVANKTMELRDAGLASALGWASYRQSGYDTASSWFELAIEWDPELNEAYYGLAMAEFSRGNLAQAEAIARLKPDADPRMSQLLANVLIQKAVAASKSNQSGAAAQSLEEASETRQLTRGEAMLFAWSNLRAGQIERAAILFENLYTQRVDEESAEGLYAALSQLARWNRLKELADRFGGPLEQVYQTRYLAPAYFSQGRIRKAVELDPQTYGIYTGIDAPSILFGFDASTRSGETTERQTDVIGAPRVIARIPTKEGYFQADVIQYFWDGGALISNPNNNGILEAAGQSFSGVAARFTFEWESLWNPSISFGVLQTNSNVETSILGSASISRDHDEGKWTLRAFVDPVMESSLSAVGFRDEVNQLSWGGVRAAGVQGELSHWINEKSLFTGTIKAANYFGTNVPDNGHFGLTASIVRPIKVNDFSYFRVGPLLTYSTFARNLNQYTFGHGGYFSPQNHVQVFLKADFMSELGKDVLFGGSMGAGFQRADQDSSSIFPLEGDSTGTYPSTTDSSFIGYISFQGTYLLGDSWSLWGNMLAARTSNYDELSISLGLTYHFEKRRALHVLDLTRPWQ
ncbi:cellulose synthase subunit BcsC-related outer membrane protein [Phragmitibacter flavus]|nr:cellulose synthase subunit BcsC-related outer membrane protein [Phragmitibacter flavus]